jgi:hypothetical protein
MDFKEFNASFNLVQFARDKGSVESSDGRDYYIGSCPVCSDGGKDRFQIKKNINGWICRICGTGKYQSPIDLIMKVYNCNAKEAVERFEGVSEVNGVSSRKYELTLTPENKDKLLKEYEDPSYSTQWQIAAEKLVNYAVKQLEEDADDQFQMLILRSISKETLLELSIGYHPRNSAYKEALFGLKDQVVVSQAYLFPIRNHLGKIIGIQQVMPSKPKDERYRVVSGGNTNGLMFGRYFIPSAGKMRLGIATEGAINYASLYQELNGKRVSNREIHVVGITSTTADLSSAKELFTDKDVLLFMLDHDPAGDKMWEKIIKSDWPCRIRRLTQPKVDFSDMTTGKLPPTITEWFDSEMEKIKKENK